MSSSGSDLLKKHAGGHFGGESGNGEPTNCDKSLFAFQEMHGNNQAVLDTGLERSMVFCQKVVSLRRKALDHTLYILAVIGGVGAGVQHPLRLFLPTAGRPQ